LPDAMEGPATTSALIHAATLVLAGAFLIEALHRFLQSNEENRWRAFLSNPQMGSIKIGGDPPSAR
jgi:NADH:ubiquinone oxidoreductase subunit 5 (subunit L)/multisubunit Na+/H+ antiporter MnhA subunit